MTTPLRLIRAAVTAGSVLALPTASAAQQAPPRTVTVGYGALDLAISLDGSTIAVAILGTAML